MGMSYYPVVLGIDSKHALLRIFCENRRNTQVVFLCHLAE